VPSRYDITVDDAEPQMPLHVSLESLVQVEVPVRISPVPPSGGSVGQRGSVAGIRKQNRSMSLG